MKAFIKVYLRDWTAILSIIIVSDHFITIAKERTLSVDLIFMTCRLVLRLVTHNRLTHHWHLTAVFRGQEGLRHKSESFFVDEFSLFLLT